MLIFMLKKNFHIYLVVTFNFNAIDIKVNEAAVDEKIFAFLISWGRVLKLSVYL